MEIQISEQTSTDANGVVSVIGYYVTFVNRNKKRSINESDLFITGTDVEAKISQLKKLLKTYFDAQV
jgi:hypothetical protein